MSTMAAVDPYAPCPCGSGQKFKWCCHKVESYAEKAHRLFEGNQIDAAVGALDEGLRKAPGNPWLTVRKALYLIRKERTDEAVPILEALLREHPEHVGAQGLMIRLKASREGAVAAASQLQHALEHVTPELRAALQPAVQLIGASLGQMGHAPAALAHLDLAVEMMGGEEEMSPTLASLIRAIRGNVAVSPWLRDRDRLGPAPDGLDGETRERFEQALGWAAEGLWDRAGAAFELLAADGVGAAERNLGFCRLWVGDDRGASEALRRYADALGATEEAVDLEALCQLIAPAGRGDMVDRVRWIWTLRDREMMLQALRSSDRVETVGTAPLNLEEPEGPQVEAFDLLDRPKLRAGEIPDDARMVPRLVGEVLVRALDVAGRPGRPGDPARASEEPEAGQGVAVGAGAAARAEPAGGDSAGDGRELAASGEGAAHHRGLAEDADAVPGRLDAGARGRGGRVRGPSARGGVRVRGAVGVLPRGDRLQGPA
jgi:tetratricopeptide (TPR) repeat protein